MSLVSTQPQFTDYSFGIERDNNNTTDTTDNNPNSSLNPPSIDLAEASLRLVESLRDDNERSMDRGAPEFSQSGLQSPYSPALHGAPSEDSPADHASAAHYTPQQVRSNNYSASITPTSEYGVYPGGARSATSATFPGHINRPYTSASNHSVSSAGMAQPPSPSLPLSDSRNNPNTQKSDQDVPIDPTIAASSPTYPPHTQQYSPYQQQEMQHGYPQQHPAAGAMYSQPRPDWAGYAGHPQPHPMQGGYPVSGANTPTSASQAAQRSQVYSFVPIPGAQQHKRPRRRYEEIERMYKCGWNGCEKAYGTLNHLNAHVTMQSHGVKRTPEEFKDIRKEWKARKKEEENARKADEERARLSQMGGAPQPSEGQPPAEGAPSGYQQPGRPGPQLPPISYQPGAQVPGQYQAQAAPAAQMQEYNGNAHINYNGYPASPYGAPNQMYSQHNGASAPKYEQ